MNVFGQLLAIPKLNQTISLRRWEYLTNSNWIS